MGDHLLTGLDDQQIEAVTATDTPLAILAGAGAGKTRTLTRRIAWQGAQGSLDIRHTLALTFTRKAAGELRARLHALGVRQQVTAGTFHAIALAQLRRRADDAGRALPQLLDRKVGLLIRLLGGGNTALSQARDVAGEIEWAKARLVDPEGYEAAAALAGRSPSLPVADIARHYERYEREKERRGLIDFDDLLTGCAQAIESDPEFASVQRWRFQHLFVDEFQDVNPAHLRLLKAWLGGRSALVVVGDDDQAIYSFSGADPSYLVDFPRHFPGGSVVRLNANYRSTPQVLVAASAVLPGGLRSKQGFRAVLADGPLPTITAYPSDSEEARRIAARIRDQHTSGSPWSATAVLYRTNAQSASFEAAFRAAGVPFRVRGASRFLERPETRSALARLERATRAAPGTPFAAVIGELPKSDDLSAEEREHAEVIVRMGSEYLAAHGGSGNLSGFLAYLATSLDRDDGTDAADGVQLLTFHRAKGLEWPTVFVTGLERGLSPIGYAETPAQHAEERRLVYVALTRAERWLHLSWAEKRSVGPRVFQRQRSPYLAHVETALAALGADGTGDWRAALARERARLKAAGSRSTSGRAGAERHPDPQVLDALVSWRRDAARASGVPAYVIFHDATLAAVADVKPDSREALLAVPGIGQVKVQRYGDALLDLVKLHAS